MVSRWEPYLLTDSVRNELEQVAQHNEHLLQQHNPHCAAGEGGAVQGRKQAPPPQQGRPEIKHKAQRERRCAAEWNRAQGAGRPGPQQKVRRLARVQSKLEVGSGPRLRTQDSGLRGRQPLFCFAEFAGIWDI
jgi:hypothetical protein